MYISHIFFQNDGKITKYFAPASGSNNDTESHASQETDYYQLALKQRIHEALEKDSTAEDSSQAIDESGAKCVDDVNMNISVSDNDESQEEICVSGQWCIEEKTDEMVSKLEYDSLKIQLEDSRGCNERLTLERLELCNAVKSLTLGTNLPTLSEKAKFELAAISGDPSKDIRFITKGIMHLYDGNHADIQNLSKSGRSSGKLSTKKIEPEKYLKLKNMFCARVRKNEKTSAEGDDRIKSFEKLLPKAITKAKKILND